MSARRVVAGVLLGGAWLWPMAPALAQPAPGPSAQPAPAPSAEPAPPAAAPAEDMYGRHMDNGVKLYNEGNYDAAIAEFEAAYKVQPNASPLINLALCYKKQAEYAKAIAVLEKAISQHADSMKPEHRAAAEKEIKEMRALLAYVRIEVTPAEAQLSVDGRPVPAEERAKLALSPGQHQLRAQADGYKPVEQLIKLVSGDSNEPVKLKLEATMGTLQVRAASPDAEIVVDGSVVGKGSFRVMRPPGIHQISVRREGGESSLRVLVKVGETALIEQATDGTLSSTALAPEPVEEDDVNHFFLLANFALLTASAVPNDFEVIPQKRWGFGVGGNAGYLVTPWAGFELMGQYSDIRVSGNYDVSTTDNPGATIEGSYRLQSFRGAAMFRLNAPGANIVRFAGAIGIGLVVERIQWDWGSNENPAPNLFDGSDFAVFPYGQLDLGAELEYSNFLAALMIQSSLQSTKHLADSLTDNPFEERANLIFGLALRAGYAF